MFLTHLSDALYHLTNMALLAVGWFNLAAAFWDGRRDYARAAFGAACMAMVR